MGPHQCFNRFLIFVYRVILLIAVVGAPYRWAEELPAWRLQAVLTANPGLQAEVQEQADARRAWLDAVLALDAYRPVAQSRQADEARARDLQAEMLRLREEMEPLLAVQDRSEEQGKQLTDLRRRHQLASQEHQKVVAARTDVEDHLWQAMKEGRAEVPETLVEAFERWETRDQKLREALNAAALDLVPDWEAEVLSLTNEVERLETLDRLLAQKDVEISGAYARLQQAQRRVIAEDALIREWQGEIAVLEKKREELWAGFDSLKDLDQQESEMRSFRSAVDKLVRALQTFRETVNTDTISALDEAWNAVQDGMEPDSNPLLPLPSSEHLRAGGESVQAEVAALYQQAAGLAQDSLSRIAMISHVRGEARKAEAARDPALRALEQQLTDLRTQVETRVQNDPAVRSLRARHQLLQDTRVRLLAHKPPPASATPSLSVPVPTPE